MPSNCALNGNGSVDLYTTADGSTLAAVKGATITAEIRALEERAKAWDAERDALRRKPPTLAR